MIATIARVAAGILVAALISCQGTATNTPAPPSEAQPLATETPDTPTPPWNWPTAVAQDTPTPALPTERTLPPTEIPTTGTETHLRTPPAKEREDQPRATPEPEEGTGGMPEPKQTEIQPMETPTPVPPRPTLEMIEAYTGSLEERNLSPLSLEAHTGYAGFTQAERNCITNRLGIDPAEAATMSTKAMACLDHRNRIRVLIDPILSSTGIISRASSDCILEALWPTDFQDLIDAGRRSATYAAASSAGRLVTVYCLSGEEIGLAQDFPVSNRERYKIYCAVTALGGTGETAALLGGDPEQTMAALAAAVARCTQGKVS